MHIFFTGIVNLDGGYWSNKMQNKYNKCHQSDLGKLSPFLQKDAKMPPSYPSRCGMRYVFANPSIYYE
jgi:hypothetical protein